MMTGQLTIKQRMSGLYQLNTYFLACQGTGAALIVDPGGDTDLLLDFVKKEGLVPKALILTHGHADPFFSPERFKDDWDIPYCIHGEDDAFFRDPGVRAATRKAVGLPPPYGAELLLTHGQRISFGEMILEVIHTPGHTPGSCCFLCQGCLFSGDTLFVGTAGRTDLPGGDLDLMVRSIRDRILPLDPETDIFPAHHNGGPRVSSTLAREMRENIYITDFILDS